MDTKQGDSVAWEGGVCAAEDRVERCQEGGAGPGGVSLCR